jgi:hypothetical protein
MLSDENMVMPVSPAYGNGGNNGMFGGDWAWIILLLLLGWGNNGNGFGGGGMNGLYPWLNQQDNITNGFQNQAMSNQLTGIQGSIGNLGTQIGAGFANAETGANARQMATMQSMNNLSAQFANCCCENRLGIANLGSDIAREACAGRTLDTQNTQSILNAINSGIQSLKDQLCQDKIDAKNENIADLERQLTMANLAASQGQQTAQILADNARQTTALEQYLNPTPIPAYVVQNPNCCQQNFGCGCGCSM